MAELAQEVATESVAVKRGRGRPRKVVDETKLELPQVSFPSGNLVMIKNKKYPYGVSIPINQAPTNNCQLLSLASFANILSQYKEKYEIQHILKCVSQRVCKRLILVDVRKTYVEKLEKLLDEKQITLKQEYKSSNSSDMCIFIIKVWSTIDPDYMTKNK